MDIRGADMATAAMFNSDQYVGETEDGRYHGFGRVTYANGNEYCGRFVEGRMDGLGTMLWDDGLKYVGEWRRNVAAGVGCLSWLNGTEYYGEVDKGKRHGCGVQIQGNVRYSGEWCYGKRHGLGTLQSPGNEYSGEWKNGRRNGWGCVRFRNGNAYEGMWKEDKMCGFGSMTWVTSLKWAATKDGDLPNPKSTSANNFREAVTKARTKMTNVGAVSPGPLGPFTPAIMASTSVAERYVGEWHNNMPHGKGEYDFQFHNITSSRDILFDSTNRYKGDFKHGKRHGFGTQFYADGTVYEGGWHENMKHGKGAIIHPDGTRDDVEMENDAPKVSRTRRPISSAKSQQHQQPSSNHNSELRVDDLLLPTDNLKDVQEVITQHRNTLKHVYAAYSAVFHPIDFDAALNRQLEKDEMVPSPEFINRDAVQNVVIPPGFTPFQRNATLTKAVIESVNKCVTTASSAALQKVALASEEYTKATGASEIDIVEGHVPTENEIAELSAEQAKEDERLRREHDEQAAGSGSSRSSQQLNGSQMMGVRAGSALMSPHLRSPTGAESAPPRSGGSRLGRSATPMDGVTRSTIEPPNDLPPPPVRRERHAIMTLHQFIVMLEDALLVDVNCQPAQILRVIQPALQRRKVSSEESSITDDKHSRIQFPQFVEALVRLADFKIGTTAPFFACSSIYKLSLAQRLRYLLENFVAPLSSSLRELDTCGLLEEMGVDPYLNDTVPDTTLEDLRRTAIRTVRDNARINAARAASSGASATGVANAQSATFAGSSTLGGDALGRSIGNVSNANTGAVSNGSVTDELIPVTGPDARPLSAGADGLDNVQVPFVSPPEVISTDIVGKRSVATIANARNSDCQLEFVVVLVKINPERLRKKHILIVNRVNGVPYFGGVIPEYQLERVKAVFENEPWFMQRGLPALRPRHICHFLPAAEALESHVVALHKLFDRCKDVAVHPETGAEVVADPTKGARLSTLLDILVNMKALSVPTAEELAAKKAQEDAAAAEEEEEEETTAVDETLVGPNAGAESVTSADTARASVSNSMAASPANAAHHQKRASATPAMNTPATTSLAAPGDTGVLLTSPSSRATSAATIALRRRSHSQSPSEAVPLISNDPDRGVSIASSAAIAPSINGQIQGMLSQQVPTDVADKRVDAVIRNVLFTTVMSIVTQTGPQPCMSTLPAAARATVSFPTDPSPQLKQLYKACPELLDAVNLRAKQEVSRNVAKKAFSIPLPTTSMVNWETIARDVELTFDQFLVVVVGLLHLLHPNVDDINDIAGPVQRHLSDFVAKALVSPMSRQTLVPGESALENKHASVPIMVPKCWPVKKKPPPKDDPKKKKGLRR